MKIKRLLVVDDEAAVLAALRRSLRQHYGRTMRVETQVSAAAALACAETQDFDLVISDLRMPEMDGVSFLRRYGRRQPHSVTMILTGSADFETAQRAINDAGVFRYLCKPWHEGDLTRHIDEALAHGDKLADQRAQAQAWQDHRDGLTPQELERRRLELLEPGITMVEWGPNGEVLMPPLTATGF